MTKTSAARTTSTSFIDTTTNLWLDAFLAGKGVILTTVNKDSDKDTDCEDNVDLIV